MARYSQCLSVVLFTILSASWSRTESSLIVEEGSSTSFECISNTAQNTVTWQLFTSSHYVNVTTCNLRSGTCTDVRSASYQGKIVNSSRSRLYIVSARRNETDFKCLESSRIYTLEVYVRPTRPVCDPVKLDTKGKNLEITCRTQNVYPSVTAVLRRNKTLVAPDEIVHSHCQANSTVENSAEVKGECTWLVSVFKMEPSTYSFYAEMSVNVSDTWKVDTPAVRSQEVSVQLTSPEAVIDTSCPVGLKLWGQSILTGSTATCMCRLTVIGFPPGQARWYDKGGSSVGADNSVDRSSTLSVFYKLSDKNQTYKCHADTPLNSSTSATMYMPKFIYDPSAVATIITSGKVCNLCPGSLPITNVTCKAPYDPGQSETLFTVFVNNKVIAEHQEGDQSSYTFSYSTSTRHTVGGIAKLMCRAENKVFPELFVEDVAKVEVREPPNTAPVITVLRSHSSPGTNIFYVANGTVVEVTCRVQGGFPLVNEVRLFCGSDVFEKEKSSAVSVKLLVNADNNGLRCRCEADHVSGCYHQTSEMYLKIEEPSSAHSLAAMLGALLCAALTHLIV